MSGFKVRSDVKCVRATFTVRKADGSVGEVREVYWHRNPLKRWAWAIKTKYNAIFS